MRSRLEITPGAVFGGCFAYYALPAAAFRALLLCCAVHEAAHLLFVRLTRGKIVRFRLSLTGAELQAVQESRSAVLLSTLAGPVSNLLLTALTLRRSPQTALISLALGCFNLLPLPALDGGRILGLLLGEGRLLHSIEASVLLLLGLAALLLARSGCGLWPVLCWGILLLRSTDLKTRLQTRGKQDKMKATPKKPEVSL